MRGATPFLKMSGVLSRERGRIFLMVSRPLKGWNMVMNGYTRANVCNPRRRLWRPKPKFLLEPIQSVSKSMYYEYTLLFLPRPSKIMPHPPNTTNEENAPPSCCMHPVRKMFVWFRFRGRSDKRDYTKEQVCTPEDKRRKEK